MTFGSIRHSEAHAKKNLQKRQVLAVVYLFMTNAWAGHGAVLVEGALSYEDTEIQPAETNRKIGATGGNGYGFRPNGVVLTLWCRAGRRFIDSRRGVPSGPQARRRPIIYNIGKVTRATLSPA